MPEGLPDSVSPVAVPSSAVNSSETVVGASDVLVRAMPLRTEWGWPGVPLASTYTRKAAAGGGCRDTGFGHGRAVFLEREDTDARRRGLAGVGHRANRPDLEGTRGIGSPEARRTAWRDRIGECRSAPPIGKRQSRWSGGFGLAAGAEELNAPTDGGVGGVDENDLGRPAAAVRKKRKVDRAGGGDCDGRDGKCRHQELGALIDEPAQRDDGDRLVGCEGECSKHRAAAIKRLLVQESRDLFPGSQREGVVSGVDAARIREKERDRDIAVVRIGNSETGS